MNPSEENASRRCPECGAVITEELPQGLCPACVMQRAFEPSASEAAEDPALTETLDAGESPRSESDSPVSFADPAVKRSGTLVDGQRFGDYTIVRRLGRGGMGTVYEADHQPTGRRVALKVLTHSLDNQEARARFLREGRLAASINHPNSVYVYGTEEIDDTPTISMELIRGGTLQQWVKARGVLDVSKAVDAVLQVIDGLEAADRKGVLHRDIKPANCFVDSSGTIKVGDFGLSISTGPRDDHEITNVTREGTFLGTPAFASPEQLRGEPLDRRSDIYSVGVTLFYLLTGQAPFAGDNMVQLLATVLDKQPPSVRSIRAEVPEELDAVIQRCLQKSAGGRFGGYDALREALLPMSSMKPAPAPPGNRLIANVIDVFTMSFGVFAVMSCGQWIVSGEVAVLPRFDADRSIYNVLFTLAMIAIVFLYYALSEWRFAKTLGKHLVGLRVVDGDVRISLRQASIRAAIFAIVPSIPSVCYSIMVRDMTFEMMQQSPIRWIGMTIGMSHYVIILGLFLTARARNAYAGIHDIASGTRVVSKPRLKASPTESASQESFDASANGERIGPYHVLQHLWGSTSNGLVLAYDAKLLRRVWVRVQPAGHPDIDSTSRNLARVTRLRWLGGKRSPTENWDCYEAPTGKPYKQSVDDGMQWNVLVGALRQLSHELTTALEEESLSGSVSIENLWITEEGSMKVLPFAHRGGSTESDVESSSDAARMNQLSAMQLLREASQYSTSKADQARSSMGTTAMPLSTRQSLVRIGNAQSIDETTQQLDRLSAQPVVNVRWRVAGMLATSVAVPAMLLVVSMIAGFALAQQKARLPEIEELARATMLLQIEKRMTSPEKEQRIAAIETWISGNYGDVIDDPETMNNMYAMIVIPPDRRRDFQKWIDAPAPTAEELAAANAMYDEMIAERQVMTPDDIGFLSGRGFMFVSAVSWMELVWFPSLITAVACRGGALLWGFGLTLMNRRGQRASRLRIFIRVFLGGIPALAIAFCFLRAQLSDSQWAGPLQFTILVAIVASLAYTMISGRRLLHDRFAGTYLVAR